LEMVFHAINLIFWESENGARSSENSNRQTAAGYRR